MNATLKISWAIFQSAPNRAHKYSWKNSDFIISNKYKKIETVFNWPQGTINALTLAFEKKLPRSSNWNITSIHSDTQKNAVACAAQFYKRGIDQLNDSQQIRIDHHGKYEISILDNSEKQLDNLFSKIIPKNALIIIDKRIKQLPTVSLNNFQIINVSISENSKNLHSVSKIFQEVSHQKICKKRPWYIIGGGVLADTASFAAHLYGADFHLIPTTLLAMIDACIGGKTGVNFEPFGKNQIGSFTFPKSVIICRAWLDTLPKRHIRSGVSEALKHCFISGNKDLTIKTAEYSRTFSLDGLYSILPDLIKIKADIIEKDPFEMGFRSVLNLGHTLAHALEGIPAKNSYAYNRICHGEAVAIGLIATIMISHKIRNLPEKDRNFMIEAIKSAKCLPSLAFVKKHLNGVHFDSPKALNLITKMMLNDKKNITPSQLHSSWILLDQFGKITMLKPNTYITEIKKNTLIEVLQELPKLL